MIPSSSMQLLANVVNFVPPAVMADLQRLVRQRQEAKDTDIMVFIPLDDYGRMMLDINAQMQMQVPFTPVLFFGDPVPVLPHDKTFIAVKTRPNGTATQAVLFSPDGREHEA